MASTGFLRWLAPRLSPEDHRLAAQQLAAVEEAAELPLRHLLWLYRGHDQGEGAYGQMICAARLRMADTEADVDGWSLRARSFAARTADFRDAPPETLALHIQGARPSAVILGAVTEGPDPVQRRPVPDPSAGVGPQPSGRPSTSSKPGRQLSPTERSLRARIGAYSLHALRDPHETTKAARAGFESRFEREVDPDGVLDPAERARRAAMARKAHHSRMAFLSAQSRRKKAARRSRP